MATVTRLGPGGYPVAAYPAVAAGNIWELYVSKNSGAYQLVTPTSTFGVKSADASSDPDETKILIPRLS